MPKNKNKMKYIIAHISLLLLLSNVGCEKVENRQYGDKTETIEDGSIPPIGHNRLRLSKGPFEITDYTPTWPKGIIKVDPSISFLDFNKFFDPYGVFYPENETMIDSLLFSGILIEPPKIPRIGRSRNRISKSESPNALLYLSQQDKKHGYILECLGGSISSDSLQLVFFDKEVGTFFINGIISNDRDPYSDSKGAIKRNLNAKVSFLQDSLSIFQETIKFNSYKLSK